jgi:hypothetical protein
MKFVGIDCAVVVLMGASLCTGQAKPDTGAAKIEFSNCQAAQIASPDGKWLLTARFAPGACPPTAPNFAEAEKKADPAVHGNGWGIELFLEDTATHTRHTIPFAGYWGQAGWSPSSQAFFVNDHSASNVTEAALYSIGLDGKQPLHKIDLTDTILRTDAMAKRFSGDHEYFYVRRWIDPQRALVQVCGHAPDTTQRMRVCDNTWAAPTVTFNFHYRAGLDGSVRPIAHHVDKVDANAEECR